MGKPIDKQQLHRQRQRFSKEFKLAAIGKLGSDPNISPIFLLIWPLAS